jgi:hypothetical protein
MVNGSPFTIRAIVPTSPWQVKQATPFDTWML